MGEPWTEDGGRMNVTGQVEIAEGVFCEQVSCMRENGPRRSLRKRNRALD